MPFGNSAAPLFFLAEITVYRPGGTTLTVAQGWGTRPRGALAPFADNIESTDTLYYSDVGYRSRAADSIGLRVYPAGLADALVTDRRMRLELDRSAVAATWGSLKVLNAGGRLNSLVASRSADGRRVRILAGRRALDQSRGILLDPSYDTLTPLFTGFAGSWRLKERELEIPIRDASYWLERPLQQNLYLGTGGLEGPTQLAGRPKPKARGGTASAPIANITPVLVDPGARIYQYNDAPGQVIALYEGGDPTNITFQANVSDLYSGTTTPGQYRTDNSRGLFQLGVKPTRLVTVDVVGNFPTAGAASTPGAVARLLMQEDAALSSSYIDTATFNALDTACPYPVGWYWPEAVTADEAVSLIVGSVNARIVPNRDGRLAVRRVTVPAPGSATAATFTPALVGHPLRTVPLPAMLDPLPYRIRWGWAKNHTIQTSDLDPDVSTARLQYLAQPYRVETWADTAILLASGRPNDLGPFETALLSQAGAAAIVAELGALWGTRRRVYEAQLPIGTVLDRELADAVTLIYPLHDLAGGKPATVLGESTRGDASSATLLLLV